MSDGELVRHFGGVAEIEKVRHVDGDFGIVFKHISEGYRAGCSWLQFRQIGAGIVAFRIVQVHGIPVIVIGGFCTAIARLCGNVDVQGTLGYAFISAGNAAFGLMMSVLCAGIAYSICGKPGIAPGVVAGYLSTQVKASFLGALICGFLIGMMVLWMQEKFPDSKALKSMYPIVIYPVLSGIVSTLLIMFVFVSDFSCKSSHFRIESGY